MNKNKLRQHYKHLLINQSPADREQRSAEIIRRLSSTAQYSKSGGILTYLSNTQEVDTVPLLETALQDGKPLWAPRLEESRIIPVPLRPDTALETGPYGIPQPSPSSTSSSSFDLIIIPGLAFTASGIRLGRGGGHFDSFLAGSSSGLKIALAFDFQIADKLPAEQHDIKMDAIITEERILDPNGLFR